MKRPTFLPAHRSNKFIDAGALESLRTVPDKTTLLADRLARSSVQREQIGFKYSAAISRFLPVFAFQLSDELPLLFVHVKVDAPVRYHLKDTENDVCLTCLGASLCVCVHSVNRARENRVIDSLPSRRSVPVWRCSGRSIGALHLACWDCQHCWHTKESAVYRQARWPMIIFFIIMNCHTLSVCVSS